MKFSKEALCGTVGLIMNNQPAEGVAPEAERLYPLRGAILANNDPEPEAAANANLADAHLFVPETPSGPILPFVERIELMIQNQVVKCLELGGGALQRYTALANRSAKPKFGQDMNAGEVNYFLPQVEADLDRENPSENTRKKCRQLRRGKYQRYSGRSAIYGFPFSYDPVLKQIHKKDKLDNFYFSPGMHVEIRVYLTANFSRGLRALAASDPALNNAARIQLWNRNARVVLDAMWLQMDRQCFPQNSAFLKSLDSEFVKRDGRDIPFTDPNELRTPLYARMTEQVWPINLHQLGYPSYAYLYWSTNDAVDGSNGHALNTNVWRFPPNIESLDVTYQDTSMLPGGQLTKLDLPATDTADKMVFFDQQKNFRRLPVTYESFYDESLGQYVLLDLRDLYLQEQKLTELDRIHINMKFNNNLSPDGYQIGLIAVCEKKLVLKPTGEHGIINAMGKPQIQG